MISDQTVIHSVQLHQYSHSDSQKIKDTILDYNQSATNESIVSLLTTNNACGKCIYVFLNEKSFCALLADAYLKEQGSK